MNSKTENYYHKDYPIDNTRGNGFICKGCFWVIVNYNKTDLRKVEIE